ncbi:GUN4 domain-containing protein [Cylindrospermopsis raciborskii]|uniref:GUN4 domain-containing protein n=1 Tax=Cylindrospermopsis raciborskii TaxID=77022 RepID=UPI001F284629|nr:GUN4 domain-containing protein [Cylindrospermopsis raciborskii]UJS06208.1 GUN4 domain-containing protein [Cylindrospermopsis raciborskii KLL07]
MKPKKLTQLLIIGILVTCITILQPLITLALTRQEIDAIATQVTVRITGTRNGSGVIIKQDNNTYTVLTNFHTFQEKGRFEIITADGVTHQLNKISRVGSSLDLATLEFNSNRRYRVIELGDSTKITRGQDIYVGGFPTGEDLRFLPGTVSGITTKEEGGYALVYRIGAFTGMSGGPILDEDGKLVGIHGKTKNFVNSLYDSTSEEYGIPLHTYLNISKRYEKLESLLKAQNFREADLETDRVMLAVANRQSEGYLTLEDAQKFPCQELRTIDNLWLKYSQGKFGFSVQQEIYKNLGGTAQFDENIWQSFVYRVGWKYGDGWMAYNNLNFTLSAPKGLLPMAGPPFRRYIFSLLLPSVKTCRV